MFSLLVFLDLVLLLLYDLIKLQKVKISALVQHSK